MDASELNDGGLLLDGGWNVKVGKLVGKVLYTCEVDIVDGERGLVAVVVSSIVLMCVTWTVVVESELNGALLDGTFPRPCDTVTWKVELPRTNDAVVGAGRFDWVT